MKIFSLTKKNICQSENFQFDKKKHLSKWKFSVWQICPSDNFTQKYLFYNNLSTQNSHFPSPHAESTMHVDLARSARSIEKNVNCQRERGARAICETAQHCHFHNIDHQLLVRVHPYCRESYQLARERCSAPWTARRWEPPPWVCVSQPLPRTPTSTKTHSIERALRILVSSYGP